MNPIVEKVRKLLELANSDNENEAKMAAQRAQQILAKYNLEMDTVMAASEVEHADFDERTVKAPDEASYIHSILDQFFFVKVLSGKRVDPFKDKDGYISYRHRTYFTMVGRSENIATAKYVREFLSRTFRELWSQDLKLHPEPIAGERRRRQVSFYAGLQRGLEKQLGINVPKSYGLVWVGSKAIRDYIDSNWKVRSNSVGRVIHDREALERGTAQGQSIRIRKGLEADASSRGRLLKGKT